MASKKQIEANRRNAEKSTGPTTPEGKARSSRNAISHGLCSREVLLREEDPEKFRDVWLGVLEELRPEGEVETYLACRVASGIWRMNRVVRIEAQLFNDSPQRTVKPEVTLGEIFKFAGAHGGNPFGKLMRYEGAIDRGIQRALRELRALQAARAANEERVADGVTRVLQRRAVEEALLNRGGAIDGRAPAPGNGALRKEPNSPSPLAPQGAASQRPASAGNGRGRPQEAGQHAPSAGPAAAPGGGAVAATGPAHPKLRNEANSLPKAAPAGARPVPGNG